MALNKFEPYRVFHDDHLHGREQFPQASDRVMKEALKTAADKLREAQIELTEHSLISHAVHEVDRMRRHCDAHQLQKVLDGLDDDERSELGLHPFD